MSAPGPNPTRRPGSSAQPSAAPARPGRPGWDWLDDGVLVYGLALLRTLWLWPVLHLVGSSLFPGEPDWLNPWAVLGLLAGGAAAAQVGRRLGRGAGGGVGNGVGAGAGLAAVAGVLVLGVLVLPDVATSPGRGVVVLVVGAALWWWGLRSVRFALRYDGLAREFLIGLVALLLVLAFGGGLLLAHTTLVWLLLAYLGVGLFLLALASIQAARLSARAAVDGPLPVPGHWWSTVLAVVGGLLLTGLVLSWLLVPSTLDRVAGGLGAVLGVIGQLFSLLVLVVAWPIFMLVTWLWSLLPPRDGMDMPRLQPPSPLFPEALAGAGAATNTAPVDLTPWWIAGAILLLAVAAVVFVLALRARQAETVEEEPAETHERILSLALVQEQLAELWRKRRQRADDGPAYLPLTGDDPATQIRRAYQGLLAWAAQRDLPRLPGQSPDQYAAALVAAWPEVRDPIQRLTALYDRARYGADITAIEAQAAQSAWAEIAALRGAGS